VSAIPRVLAIAGTDPTGGAGLHADLKSISANRGYGMGVVTALVAQNTRGVRGIHLSPPEFLREQLDAVSDDVAIDAVKIGMLGTSEHAGVVSSWLNHARPPAVVLDPVMISTSGHGLLDPRALDDVRRLLDLVDLVTPNLLELGTLTGEGVARSWDEALQQAQRLAIDSGTLVLVKGGHLGDSQSPDAIVDRSGVVSQVDGSRIETPNTHGTGCSLSSALATNFARFGSWERALEVSKSWLSDSIRGADELDVGEGRGPVHHFRALWRAGPDLTVEVAGAEG